MTVKTRGIRLKNHLDPEDQGQRKLMQVTYSQLVALDQTTPETASGGVQPQQPLITQRGATATPAPARRRAIARMLRVELEATLALLDQALEDIAAGTQTKTVKQPGTGSGA